MRGMLHTSSACDWRDLCPLPMKLVLSLLASTTTHVQRNVPLPHVSTICSPSACPPTARAAQVDAPPVAPSVLCVLCARAKSFLCFCYSLIINRGQILFRNQHAQCQKYTT